jgi:hypothetical protein
MLFKKKNKKIKIKKKQKKPFEGHINIVESKILRANGILAGFGIQIGEFTLFF